MYNSDYKTINYDYFLLLALFNYILGKQYFI